MLQRWLRCACVLFCLAAGVFVATAQTPNPDKPNDPNAPQFEENAEPVFQLNVSPRLLMQGIDMLVEKRLVKDYGLDEFQEEELKQLLRREVPKFLQQHQAELETLATEWLEAASGSEPPSPEYAAQWAARLRPIVEDGEQLIGRVGEGMREFLGDEQKPLLDAYMVGAGLATRQIKGTLNEFESGKFDPEKHWVGNRQVRRRGPEEIRQLESRMAQARDRSLEYAYGEIDEPPAVSSDLLPPGKPAAPGDDRHTEGRATPPPAGGAPGGSAEAKPGEPTAPKSGKAGAQPAAPKHEWEIYVEQFIRKYSLHEEQQQKARLFLGQAMEQRQTHLSRNGPRMEKITKLFELSKTEEQRQTAENAFKELNTPLDRMFDRLKGKLEQLPTRQQRAAALEAESQRPSPK